MRWTIRTTSSASSERGTAGEDIVQSGLLRLYDTRRRGTFAFRPGDKSAVTIYVCGVTPYDTTHLGHARTFLVFDVLTRLLEGHRFETLHVELATRLVVRESTAPPRDRS